MNSRPACTDWAWEQVEGQFRKTCLKEFKKRAGEWVGCGARVTVWQVKTPVTKPGGLSPIPAILLLEGKMES